MGPIDFLTRQHRQVEALFQRIRQAEGSERVRLCDKLAEELTIHTQLEEQLFYPEAERRGLEAVVERSLTEHGHVKELVAELLQLRQDDPRLLETVARIEHAVSRHIDEEERHLFPRFVNHVPRERLETLEEQLERSQDDLRNEDLLAIAEAQAHVQ